MLTINKLPIAIVGNYRTGSSVLGRTLAQQHSVPWLPEPYHRPHIRNQLEQCYNTGVPYVTKFIVDQLTGADIYQKVLASDCYKIRITRRDLLAQVVSYYIASQKNTWVQKSKTVPSYNVEINADRMKQLASTIIRNNALLMSLNVEFDLDVVYEDLDFDEDGSYKTTPPENFDAVVELAQITIEQLQHDCI